MTDKSFDTLAKKIRLLKPISEKIKDARHRMRLWSPKPNCSNFVRANYHTAYKDLGRHEKVVKNDLLDLFEWLESIDFDIYPLLVKHHTRKRWLFGAITFLLGIIVGKYL